MARDINDLELGLVAPKFDNSGKKIKADELKDVAEDMSEEFGGVTIEPSVLGCWKNDETGKLMCEENVKFTSALDTEDPDSPSRARAERFMEQKAEEVGREFGQWAVMTTEEKTEVQFVDGEFSPSIEEEKTGQSPFNRLI